MLTNDSKAEEINSTNMTSMLVMPDYVVQSKFMLEGVLLPSVAAFGFLGKFERLKNPTDTNFVQATLFPWK